MFVFSNVRNTQELNKKELELGLIGKKSWHDKYKDSAWVFMGGLPYDLTEGDIICVFSQYGEIVNVNLVRDKQTGKSKGYGFLCYEDQRSTVLAVDNLNAFNLLGRTIRVDHVEGYRQPKDQGDEDEITKKLRAEGCAPKLEDDQETEEKDDEVILPVKREKKEKHKKAKKKEKKKKKKKKCDSSDSDCVDVLVKIKAEKVDKGYNKAISGGGRTDREGNGGHRAEGERVGDNKAISGGGHTDREGNGGHRAEGERVGDNKAISGGGHTDREGNGGHRAEGERVGDNKAISGGGQRNTDLPGRPHTVRQGNGGHRAEGEKVGDGRHRGAAESNDRGWIEGRDRGQRLIDRDIDERDRKRNWAKDGRQREVYNDRSRERHGDRQERLQNRRHGDREGSRERYGDGHMDNKRKRFYGNNDDKGQ